MTFRTSRQPTDRIVILQEIVPNDLADDELMLAEIHRRSDVLSMCKVGGEVIYKIVGYALDHKDVEAQSRKNSP